MTEVKLPDYLKDLVDDTASSMVSNTGGAPRISIRGRMFRFIKDGSEEEQTTDPINVIIAGVVPDKGMAKTWYESGYQPGSTDPPDCSSFLGIRPDDWVDKPQADLCVNCPQNKWGSAVSMKGGKAKACKDSKRLMLIRAEELKVEVPTIYIFNVTIASLKALSEYGKFLLSNKVPMAAAITQLSFVDSEFPQVNFEFAQVLNEEFGKKTLRIANDKEWMQGLDQTALAAPEAPPQQKIAAPSGPPQNPPAPTDNDAPPANTDDLLNNWS